MRGPDAFEDVPLTYREVGATRLRRAPVGYRAVERVQRIGSGPADLERAADALLGWRMHQRAGVRIFASHPLAEPGAVVVQRVGWGPFGLSAPCRVVYVVQDDTRRGFAYGTLPGHPESGEESFVLHLDRAGVLSFTVRAFSRPATALTRIAGPAGRLAQDVAVRRYLRAMAALTRPQRR